MINVPKISPRDPWHSVREDARHYCHLNRYEVLRVTDALRKMSEAERAGPWVPRDAGVNVRRWRQAGYREAMDHAAKLLIETYLESEFRDLLSHWSHSGARDRLSGILLNLRRAIDLGIWTVDGVRDFNPDDIERSPE